MKRNLKNERVCKQRVAELQRSLNRPVDVKFVKCIRGDPGISATTYHNKRRDDNDGRRWNLVSHELNFTHRYIAKNSPEEIRKGVAHEMAHIHTMKRTHGKTFKKTCVRFGGGDRCGKYIE